MTKTLVPRRPHRLSVWMKDKGYTPATYAAHLTETYGLNWHQRTIDRWCEGTNFPEIERAQILHVDTAGAVSIMDWPTEFIQRRRSALSRAAVKTDEHPKTAPPTGSAAGAEKPRRKRAVARSGNIRKSERKRS